MQIVFSGVLSAYRWLMNLTGLQVLSCLESRSCMNETGLGVVMSSSQLVHGENPNYSPILQGAEHSSPHPTT